MFIQPCQGGHPDRQREHEQREHQPADPTGRSVTQRTPPDQPDPADPDPQPREKHPEGPQPKQTPQPQRNDDDDLGLRHGTAEKEHPLMRGELQGGTPET